MLCITVAKGDKWANVIASKVIGVSKHIDYALFHWKAKDVKALKLPLSKFIFVNAAGVVDEVILADQLAARGSNFKTAKRDSHPLTDEEQWEIEAAIELVRTGGTPDAGSARPAGAGNAVEENEPATVSAAIDEGNAPAADPTSPQSEGDVGGGSNAADDEAQDVSTNSPLALVKPTRIAHHKKRR